MLALSSKMSNSTATSERDIYPVLSCQRNSSLQDEVVPMVQPTVSHSVPARRSDDIPPVRTVLSKSPVVKKRVKENLKTIHQSMWQKVY